MYIFQYVCRPRYMLLWCIVCCWLFVEIYRNELQSLFMHCLYGYRYGHGKPVSILNKSAFLFLLLFFFLENPEVISSFMYFMDSPYRLHKYTRYSSYFNSHIKFFKITSFNLIFLQEFHSFFFFFAPFLGLKLDIIFTA